MPAVGGLAGSQPASYTGAPGPGGGYRAPRRRRKAPIGLRLLTWLVLFLLLVGAAGLGVDHYKPQWLRDIHVLKSTAHLASRTRNNSYQGHHTHRPPQRQRRSSQTRSTGVGTATVKVAASNYSIVVSTFNFCWVEAQTPLNANPLIDQTLQPGQTASIPVTGGPVDRGAGIVGRADKSRGRRSDRVQAGRSRPNAVPFQVNFTSS